MALGVSASAAGQPTPRPCGHEGRESGGLLLASWVQEEARKCWTPILKHTDQRSTVEVVGHAILGDPRAARSLKRSLNQERIGKLRARGVCLAGRTRNRDVLVRPCFRTPIRSARR